MLFMNHCMFDTIRCSSYRIEYGRLAFSGRNRSRFIIDILKIRSIAHSSTVNMPVVCVAMFIVDRSIDMGPHDVVMVAVCGSDPN